MSEEMSIGVKILLERVKSNPEEMSQEYGKWHQIRDAVFDYVERGERRAWLRGLRPDEIDLLYKAFCTGSRQLFDNYVLKNVLGADEEETPKVDAYTLSQGKRAMQPPTKFPPPVIDPNYNPYQNVIQPGQIVPITTTQTSTTSLVTRLKQELGIK